MIVDNNWNKYDATEHLKVPTDGKIIHTGTHCTHFPEYGNDKVQMAVCRGITNKGICESAAHPECAWTEAKVKAGGSNKKCGKYTSTATPPNL
jgi:hypothetical protein